MVNSNTMGEFFESFRKNNFVAIEHEKISIYDVNRILQKNSNDRKLSLKELKAYSQTK